jgi:hypothetical protein
MIGARKSGSRLMPRPIECIALPTTIDVDAPKAMSIVNIAFTFAKPLIIDAALDMPVALDTALDANAGAWSARSIAVSESIIA